MVWSAPARVRARNIRILGHGSRIGRLHLHGDSLYFTEGARVMRLPAAGGALEPVCNGLRSPLALNAQAEELIVCDAVPTRHGPRRSRVERVWLRSGARETLLEGPFGPDQILRDSGRLYWTNPAEGRIEQLDLASGELETRYASGTARPMQLGRTSAHTFWVEVHRRTLSRMLWRAPLGDEPSGEPLIELRREPTGIIRSYAADDSDLIFEVGSALTVLEPDGYRLTLASTSGPAHHIVLHGDWVYWSDVTGLHRVRRSGGGRECLFPAAVMRFVVDDRAVYWSTEGRIFRLVPSSSPRNRHSDIVPKPR